MNDYLTHRIRHAACELPCLAFKPIVVNRRGTVIDNPHECPECKSHSPGQTRHFVGCSRYLTGGR